MRRIRIAVAYDGTEYHGWQVQPGLPTIQGELERAVAEIEGRPTGVAGSGRTDAGVHATEQVAAFSLANPIPAGNLQRALNRLLPRAIRVTRCEEAAQGFHPRFDAVAKSYEYSIWRLEICPPRERLYVHHYPYPLDEGRMAEAATVFEGEHDFSAFAAADEKDARGGSKVRTIYFSRLARHGPLLVYRVRGSGFLKHMVRMLAGTLIEVGKGNLSREDVRARLEAGWDGKGGPSLPASGLCLVGVEYENEMVQ